MTTRFTTRRVRVTMLIFLTACVPPPRPPATPTPTPMPNVDGQPPAPTSDLALKENWRKTITQTPRPKAGCFTASYPDTQWREVECTTPPNKPYPPRHGTRPGAVVGGGSDAIATVTGHLSSAEGSFDGVTGVTNEFDNGSANVYSLQLNSQFFTTAACNSSPKPASCSGWEQFIYSSSGVGFIQYWLLDFGPTGTTCPAGFGAYVVTTTNEVDCYINAAHSTPVPGVPITSLVALKLTGTAAAAGKNDFMTVAVGNTVFSATGDNHFPELSTSWQQAEFNVFGDGGSSQADFNMGAEVGVRTSVTSGTTAAPAVTAQGFTGETNNLTIVGAAAVHPATGTASPSISFLESNLFENRVIETATTFVNQSNGTWLMPMWSNPGGKPDLGFIQTSNTPNNRVALHIASAASNFQTQVLATPTTFINETDGTWTMASWSNPGGKPDLVFIKTDNTPNKHVEVHVASAASNYQARVFESATTFVNETDGTWLMANWTSPIGKPDLVFIKTANTPSGRVEVHVASAASNYQQRVFESVTTFGNETDGTWLMANWMSPVGKPDLVFIKTSNTPSGLVEVHIASAASNYQTRIIEIPTTFGNETDGVWLMPRWTNPGGQPDLGFIKTSNTPKGHVEVHIAGG